MRKGLELLEGSRSMNRSAAKPDSATIPRAIATVRRW
jgi:hypothetical protein